MLDHECRVDRAGDRTLVEVVVANETAVDRRVRVENRLDGRVEPPRENGVPAPGWDDDGYAGVVPAHGRLTLGYACAGAPTDPPVAVHDEGRPTDDEAGEATAADAVRLLGDHAPPADVVPAEGDEAPVADEDGAPTVDVTGTSADGTDDPPAPVAAMVEQLDEGETATANGEPLDGAAATTDDRHDEYAPSPGETAGDVSAASPESGSLPDTDESHADPAPPVADDTPDDLPPAVASWLADVRGRVADAEALAAGDLAAAARVVDDRGGATAAAALDDDLAADEAALRALAAEAERLADRAGETEVPVAALRRLS